MLGYNEIQEWLHATVRLLADNPDQVIVELHATDPIMLRIHVDASDQGKIIGKQARTIQSIRVLTGAMAMKFKIKRVQIDVADQQSPIVRESTTSSG